MTKPTEVGVGLLGLGVVGSGVARVLHEKRDALAALAGGPISIKRILVRDLGKARGFNPPADLLTTDVGDILGDARVHVLVEVMGGADPAMDYILKGMSRGMSVATANKEVMARHGPDILAQARKMGTEVRFEASVAGGTPIIAPLLRDLVANDVLGIHAIINGTTNYILTKMDQEGLDFDVALRQAQELGYAEADPTNDVEGVDAAYKLAILSTLAFRARVRDTDVYREGITRLQARDFLYARELGYAIKLMAIAAREGKAIQARVHPVFVPSDTLIAKVNGVLNAVEVQTDLAGRVLFHGRGAGSLPTASAVVADVVDIARGIFGQVRPFPPLPLAEDVRARPIADLETRYYFRMTVLDRPGVLAQIARILGDLGISIASVIQKESDARAQRAELVFMTHRASEAAMQKATLALQGLDVVAGVGNVVRVEEWDSEA